MGEDTSEKKAVIEKVEVEGKQAPAPPSILRPGLPITEESLIHGRRPDAA